MYHTHTYGILVYGMYVRMYVLLRWLGAIFSIMTLHTLTHMSRQDKDNLKNVRGK